MINGSMIMDDQWKTAMRQADVIGRCVMAQTILNVDANDLGDSDEE